MDKKYIIIKADTNDGDYIYTVKTISGENIQKILPVIKAISEFKPYMNQGYNHDNNFPYSEYSRPDLGEKTLEQLYVETGKITEKQLEFFLDEYCPYGENGIHSIESIKILHVFEEENLI